MFTLWTDLDRAFFRDPLRGFRSRDLDQILNDLGNQLQGQSPRMRLQDLGEELLFTMELPGVALDDIEAIVQNDVLTVRAQRNARFPEGYRAHLAERKASEIQQSISLPVPVDPEQTSATAKDGVLKIRLATTPESKPRQITVTAG
jgi:HSP20 family protein